MTYFKRMLRPAFFVAVLAFYLYFSLVGVSNAAPTGVEPTLISSDPGPTTNAGSRTDDGGTINTITVDVVSQDTGWKAYVGNITGKMALRNSDSVSIYEWDIDSAALSGYIFVSRNGSINWSLIRCANTTIIDIEQAVLGMNTSSADSLNRTFNYSSHKGMTFSGGIPPINQNTCPSTATYVNGSAQEITESSYFQEILLTDLSTLVYGTFIDQNSFGFDNNDTNPKQYDFQFMVGENKTASTGNTYYFYAEISG